MATLRQEQGTVPVHLSSSHLPRRVGASEQTWIFGNQPTLRSRWRLFCFPNAGGGASAYIPWVRGLAPAIEVCPVQLPGRENRLGERPISHMDEMVQKLAQALLPYWGKPFAFFGHSMGALIAFSLARHLRQQGLPLPEHLFLSAYRAPHLPPKDRLHGIAEEELVQKMLTLNGTRQEVFANPELRRLLLPIFRADFELCETYTCTPEPPLALPVTVLGGMEDTRAGQKELEGWCEYTSQPLRLQMLPGDHFFCHNDPQAVWSIIARTLATDSDGS